MKNEAGSGEKESQPQPVDNSLASFRHQRGEIVPILGLQTHVLALVANSTLLNYIRRN